MAVTDPTITIPIDAIRVEHRHRKDFGDLDKLANDPVGGIAVLGLLQPIGVTPDYALVYGERRLRACRDILGWTEIPARIVDIEHIVSGEYAENELRKDFTPSERVAIGLTIERVIPERRGRPSKIVQNFAQVSPGVKTREVAAKAAGFGNPETYRQAKRVVEEGAPELVDAMDAGVAAISTAADIATLPEADQREVVAQGERAILEAAKAIRQRKAEERRQERIAKIVEIAKQNEPLDASLGKFSVIYADPPWRYEHIESESRAIENQYPTMSLDEICAMPVQDICADDCVLFLWATSPKLAEAMRVIEFWGFDYRTSMVWVKDKIGMGYYARQRHELLLIAKRGNPVTPEPSARPDSVVESERTEHSRKPEIFYDLIERMYPEFPRVELFCRTPRPGWRVWGNQA